MSPVRDLFRALTHPSAGDGIVTPLHPSCILVLSVSAGEIVDFADWRLAHLSSVSYLKNLRCSNRYRGVEAGDSGAYLSRGRILTQRVSVFEHMALPGQNG